MIKDRLSELQAASEQHKSRSLPGHDNAAFQSDPYDAADQEDAVTMAQPYKKPDNIAKKVFKKADAKLDTLLASKSERQAYLAQQQLAIEMQNQNTNHADRRENEVEGMLRDISVIKSQVAEIQQKLDGLKLKHQEMLHPGAYSQEELVRQQILDQNAAISGSASGINVKLKQMKQKIKAKREQIQEAETNPAIIIDYDEKVMLRTLEVNYNALTHQFRDIMETHADIQNRYRDGMKSKLKKQLRLVDDEREFDDQELEMMIDDQDFALFDDGFQLAQEKKQLLNDLEMRRKEMEELEKSMTQLYELFAEVAVLIEEQGVQVNNIYENVMSTESYIVKANEDIRQAVIYQSSARKKKICLLVCCIVTLIVVLLIVLWQLGVFTKSASTAAQAVNPNP